MAAATWQMKQKTLALAVIGGAACVAMALWPARSPLYFAAAYAGLSVCALGALLCVQKPRRWLALLALLFGLSGVFIGWRSYARNRIASNKPSQTQLAGAPAWIQWSSTVGGNNRYYALTPSATNWAAAQSLAVSWGGHLATIQSAEEQNFLNETFLTGKFEHLPLWIGLVRIYTNSTTTTSANGSINIAVRLRRAMADLGLNINLNPNNEFAWVTGEDFSYSNWHPNQPDNFSPGESYVAMNWHSSDSPPRGIKGDWNDAPLNGTTGFGGNTDGPYFGVVELGLPPEPKLTPSRWGLLTMAALALAAGAAFISLKMRPARPAEQ